MNLITWICLFAIPALAAVAASFGTCVFFLEHFKEQFRGEQGSAGPPGPPGPPGADGEGVSPYAFSDTLIFRSLQQRVSDLECLVDGAGTRGPVGIIGSPGRPYFSSADSNEPGVPGDPGAPGDDPYAPTCVHGKN